MLNFGDKVSFLWSVDDLIRGPYRKIRLSARVNRPSDTSICFPRQLKKSRRDLGRENFEYLRNELEKKAFKAIEESTTLRMTVR